jgi:hypothetical protein
MMIDQSKVLVTTGFLPKGIATAEQATAIMLKGREIGIPPMQSFGQISIIQGKPTVSPELMLALIYKNCPSGEVIFKELSNHICKIEARRQKDHPLQPFSFSMEDAKKAELAGKGNWQKYPRAMLRSRCIAEMARSIFPDAIMGCSYTPEEMGATVNEDNEIIEVAPTPQPEPKPEEPKPVNQKPEPAPANARLDSFKLRLEQVLCKALDEGLDVAEVFRVRMPEEIIASVLTENDCVLVAQKIDDWRTSRRN